MPFKSQAQRRKFAQLLVQGKIKPETFEEWNRETGNAKLPEHAPRKRAKKAAKTTAKKKTTARKKTAGKTAKRTAKKRSRARRSD
jgi:hypothetical protein